MHTQEKTKHTQLSNATREHSLEHEAVFDFSKLRKRERCGTPSMGHCLITAPSMPDPPTPQVIDEAKDICNRINTIEVQLNGVQQGQQTAAEQIARLEQQFQSMEEEVKSTITCRVCYKKCPIEGFSYVNMLGCGHAFCSICCFSMKECAICRAPVVGKFKLFI